MTRKKPGVRCTTGLYFFTISTDVSSITFPVFALAMADSLECRETIRLKCALAAGEIFQKR